MKTKDAVIAILALVALVLFIAVGFDLFTWEGHSLLAIGLAVQVVAFLLDRYWDAG